MFNSGEIALFRRTGLTPVFFGEGPDRFAIAESTYLLTYPDMAAREKGWDTFRNDPEWKKLSTTPGYHRSGNRHRRQQRFVEAGSLLADLRRERALSGYLILISSTSDATPHPARLLHPRRVSHRRVWRG